MEKQLEIIEVDKQLEVIEMDEHLEPEVDVTKRQLTMMRIELDIMKARCDLVMDNSLTLCKQHENVLELLKKIEEKRSTKSKKGVLASPTARALTLATQSTPTTLALAIPGQDDFPAPILEYAKTISSIANLVSESQEKRNNKAPTPTNVRRSARLQEKQGNKFVLQDKTCMYNY